MKDLIDQLHIPRDRPPAAPPRRPAPRWRATRVLAAVLLAVPAAVGSWRYFVMASPLAVDVVTVTAVGGPGPAGTVLTAGGYIRDPRVVYVAPRVAGRISILAVKEGDEVRAGDLVAVIDSRDLEQEANEARANVDVAEANLRKLQAGSRPQEIAEMQAKVQTVALTRARADRELARSRALLDAGVISAQAFDQAQTDAEISERNLAAARQSLALIEAGPRTEEIDTARAVLAAARARWATATNRLGYTRVVAPVAGRVLRKFRNVGDFVSPDIPYIENYETVAVGSPVVSLAENGAQEVSSDINETEIARISLHQPAEITPNAYPGEVFRGSVTRVSPRADKNKNTVEVRVTIEHAPRVLPYDTSVKLAFLGQPVARGNPVLSVPASAVVVRNGRRFVFVAVASRASLRAVDVGAREGDSLAITSGLADGARVIVSHLAGLADGTPIAVK